VQLRCQMRLCVPTTSHTKHTLNVEPRENPPDKDGEMHLVHAIVKLQPITISILFPEVATTLVHRKHHKRGCWRKCEYVWIARLPAPPRLSTYYAAHTNGQTSHRARSTIAEEHPQFSRHLSNKDKKPRLKMRNPTPEFLGILPKPLSDL
jgi:hypothetical protein